MEKRNLSSIKIDVIYYEVSHNREVKDTKGTFKIITIYVLFTSQAYQQRAFDYGPIYKEQIGAISTVVISDPLEYNKVIRSEGKYPNRREMEPMAHYRRKKKIGLGLVNAYVY